MLTLLLNLAHATPPQVSAFISTDGQYSLILRSEIGWQEAEIAIAGDGAEDVGALEAGSKVRIDGFLDGPGVIWVNVSAAIDETTGMNWVFSVEPQVVPARSPRLDRLSRRPLRWFLFKRRKG
jgi:hypothetical protein